ncbi:unnamed protein product [Lota lota]
MSLKVQTSNVTNKTDPKSINSRVFIGNLNTAVVKKSDVETIFSAYGRVLGCSVHKGFAFVQYAGERQARAAVLTENGRVLAGQTLDINMAGEPRPNRPKGLKRSASIYSGYEFDYDYCREDFYDRLFEYRGRVSPPVPRTVPAKRPRLAVPLVRRVKSLPVKLLSRNTSVLPTSNNKHKLRGLELQAIKSELTQIKTNIEALLCRLELISEDTHITPTESRKDEEEEEEEEECKSEELSVDDEDWCSEGQEEEEEEERRNSHAAEEHSHDRAQHNMVRCPNQVQGPTWAVIRRVNMEPAGRPGSLDMLFILYVSQETDGKAEPLPWLPAAQSDTDGVKIMMHMWLLLSLMALSSTGRFLVSAHMMPEDRLQNELSVRKKRPPPPPDCVPLWGSCKPNISACCDVCSICRCRLFKTVCYCRMGNPQC